MHEVEFDPILCFVSWFTPQFSLPLPSVHFDHFITRFLHHPFLHFELRRFALCERLECYTSFLECNPMTAQELSDVPTVYDCSEYCLRSVSAGIKVSWHCYIS